MTRFSPVIRWVMTTALVGVCVSVCAGFWLTVTQEDHSILGRYSVPWFVVALCVSVLGTVLACWRVRGHFRKPPTAPSPGLSAGKKLLFSAITMVAILIIAEVALRLTLFAALPDEEPRLMTLPKNYHALLQVTDRKLVDGQWVRAYRDKVYDRAKSTEFRIVCLGGSTTYGHDHRPEAAWPAVAERLLRERGYDVEVINAGMPWYATAHSLANYVLHMRYYEPDVVVVMHGVNDLCRSFPKSGEPDPELDYGSYQGPLYLALSAARQSSGRRPRLIAGSALWTLVSGATNFNRYYYSALRERERRSPNRRIGERKANEAGEFDFTPADYPSIESFKTHLNYLVEVCRRDGRPVLLGTQAHIYGRDIPEGDVPATAYARVCSVFPAAWCRRPVSAAPCGPSARPSSRSPGSAACRWPTPKRPSTAARSTSGTISTSPSPATKSSATSLQNSSAPCLITSEHPNRSGNAV